MSVARPLEMSPSPPIPGRARRAGDGADHDEQEGTRAPGGARRPGGGPSDGGAHGLADRGERAAGVPALEGVPGAWPGGAGLASPRAAEETAPRGRGTGGGGGRDPR